MTQYRIAGQIIAHRILESSQHVCAFGRDRFNGRPRQGRNPPLCDAGGILAIGPEIPVRLGGSVLRWSSIFLGNIKKIQNGKD
jgi:hypothetical protein